MKYSAVAVAALVALASAQADVSIIPTCAIPCIDDAAAANTDCKAKDYTCICENVEVLTAKATKCVLKECGNDVALNKVLPGVETFCKATLAEPVKTTSAAPKTTSASAAPVKSTVTESSAAHTSAHEESSSAEPTYAVSSIVSVASSSVVSSSVVSSPTKSAPASSSPTKSAPASTSSAVTAGAAGLAGSFGLLVLGAVAAL